MRNSFVKPVFICAIFSKANVKYYFKGDILMRQTNNEKLRERIKHNYNDFKADMLKLIDGGTMFGLARKIAATQDVYELSLKPGWVDESEAAYLLEFAEPLKMLADAWEDFLFGTDSEFRMIVEDILDNDDNMNNYVTAVYADELKRKHGGDTSVRGALFLELVETVRKYALLKNMLDDEGGGYCFDEG